MSGARKTYQAGFTLVEMLVAMFIFSLISIGTMSALSSAFSGKAQMSDALDRLAQIETARALIKSDLATIELRPMRDEYGTTELFVFAGGAEELLKFTRFGRDNPGGLETRGDLQRVRYLFENGQLIRESLVRVNPAPDTPSIRRVLLDDIADADIEFLYGDQTVYSQFFIPVTGSTVDVDRIRLILTFETGEQLTQLFEFAP